MLPILMKKSSAAAKKTAFILINHYKLDIFTSLLRRISMCLKSNFRTTVFILKKRLYFLSKYVKIEKDKAPPRTQTRLE